MTDVNILPNDNYTVVNNNVIRAIPLIGQTAFSLYCLYQEKSQYMETPYSFSTHKLSQMLGVSKTTIQKANETLQNLGFISIYEPEQRNKPRVIKTLRVPPFFLLDKVVWNDDIRQSFISVCKKNLFVLYTIDENGVIEQINDIETIEFVVLHSTTEHSFVVPESTTKSVFVVPESTHINNNIYISNNKRSNLRKFFFFVSVSTKIDKIVDELRETILKEFDADIPEINSLSKQKTKRNRRAKKESKTESASAPAPRRDLGIIEQYVYENTNGEMPEKDKKKRAVILARQIFNTLVEKVNESRAEKQKSPLTEQEIYDMFVNEQFLKYFREWYTEKFSDASFPLGEEKVARHFMTCYLDYLNYKKKAASPYSTERTDVHVIRLPDGFYVTPQFLSFYNENKSRGLSIKELAKEFENVRTS